MPVKRASAVRTTEADVCEDPLAFCRITGSGHAWAEFLPGASTVRAGRHFSFSKGSPDERENSVSILSND